MRKQQTKIKNYSIIVPANQSISEIQESLVMHGATSILCEYDSDGKIIVMKFKLVLQDLKSLSFSLPCNWLKFQSVMRGQNIKRWDDKECCYRVAWRCIRDWVIAQMALYETEMVTIPQIFLPYAITQDGNTLFEQIASDPKLLLGN